MLAYRQFFQLPPVFSAPQKKHRVRDEDGEIHLQSADLGHELAFDFINSQRIALRGSGQEIGERSCPQEGHGEKARHLRSIS